VPFVQNKAIVTSRYVNSNFPHNVSTLGLYIIVHDFITKYTVIITNSRERERYAPHILTQLALSSGVSMSSMILYTVGTQFGSSFSLQMLKSHINICKHVSTRAREQTTRWYLCLYIHIAIYIYIFIIYGLITISFVALLGMQWI